MITKEEAEEKLLKIFYDVKLDNYFKLYPTHANIVEFEETKDPNEFDYYYGIKDDELQIGMWANNFEDGISYFAVIMAHGSAKHWREDPLYKYMKLYVIFHLIFPIITWILGIFINNYSLFGAIIINIIGTGTIIYFLVLANNWKKRVLIRFRENFKNTSIVLSEEFITKYSKTLFPDIIAIYVIQCFIFFIFILSWVSIFSKGV